jgi:hypothetical protein
MRSIFALAAAALALAAFATADAPLVTVRATCDDGRLGAHSVTPDTVTIAQDESIDWELDASSNATAFTVEPKHPGKWLFAHDEHFKGGKGKGDRAHANGEHMNKHAAGSYQYNVVLDCVDAHGATVQVTIDPTIIVH